jgi:hypothetical protein
MKDLLARLIDSNPCPKCRTALLTTCMCGRGGRNRGNDRKKKRESEDEHNDNKTNQFSKAEILSTMPALTPSQKQTEVSPMQAQSNLLSLALDLSAILLNPAEEKTELSTPSPFTVKPIPSNRKNKAASTVAEKQEPGEEEQQEKLDLFHPSPFSTTLKP